MSSIIKPGKYRHYKGHEYEVIDIARHSETLEEMVVYRALYESKDFGKDTLWVRPAHMFTEVVTTDSKQIPRFEYIGG